MHLIAVPLLLVLIACAAHAADSKITIEDLTQRAADWYLRLAKTGDARAQTSLGLMYARGYGVPKNLAEAHRWWNFAAIQNDPGAQYNLGLTYVRGEGVTVDYERAAR
jgi:TPR repeat protein